MSLTFRLTHTVFDGSSNVLPNLLMWPTQSLFDSRTYYFFKTKERVCSHICFDEATTKVMQYFEMMIGLIHSCYCVFNLVGLTMKSIAYLKEWSNGTYKQAYVLTEAAINEKGLMVNMPALKGCPPKVEPSKEELEAIKSIKLTELVDIWSEVATHSQKESAAERLTDWLTKIVPNSNTYTHIAKEVLEDSRAELERNLKLVIYQMRTNTTLSNDQKERHILEILDKAYFTKEELSQRAPHSKNPLENLVSCSPTWLEITWQVYKEIKAVNTVEARLLLYLQDIKDDIIHELTEDFQRTGYFGNVEWHGLNIGRRLVGKEIGLDLSTLKYDSIAGVLNVQQQLFLRFPVLQEFYKRCKPDDLKTRLIKKISQDNEGANGQDQELMPYLQPFVEQYFKEKKIEYDEITFHTLMIEHFFDKEPGKNKYHFNLLAAEGMLKQMGILD